MSLLATGYFPKQYNSEGYWQDDYWPDSVAFDETLLLTAGYFHPKDFPAGYWQDDYWPDYGFRSYNLRGILLRPGYWQTNYFPQSHFAPGYWPAFNTVYRNKDYKPYRRKYKEFILREDEELLELIQIICASGVLDE